MDFDLHSAGVAAIAIEANESRTVKAAFILAISLYNLDGRSKLGAFKGGHEIAGVLLAGIEARKREVN